jgi:formylaminopyrimidine deformylase / aminopyrimidine aminohydrolase
LGECDLGHPVYQRGADGTLPQEAFRRWLIQDRHFIDGLYQAQARVIPLVTGEARRTLLNGVVALQEEMDWLADRATHLGLDLAAEPVDDCLAFTDYLQTLAFVAPSVALTAIWAVERSYLDAWSAARPGAAPYREFVEHWSNDGFRAYVDALHRAANEALQAAATAEHAGAHLAFRRVMTFERRFWAMTNAG